MEVVGGSNPSTPTNARALFEHFADVAQLVARHLAKVKVAGSSPVIRSNPERGRWDMV